MELSQIIPHIEALIFASDRPLVHAELLEMLNNALAFIEDRASIEQVEAAVGVWPATIGGYCGSISLRRASSCWKYKYEHQPQPLSRHFCLVT